MERLLLINIPPEELLTDSGLQAKLRSIGVIFDAIQIDRSKSKALVYVNNSEKLRGILGYAEDDVVVSDVLDSTSALFDEKYNRAHHGIMLGMGQKDSYVGDEALSKRIMKFKEGDKISGKIKSITDFGIFIGLDDGIDGMIHLSDIFWNTQVEEN